MCAFQPSGTVSCPDSSRRAADQRHWIQRRSPTGRRSRAERIPRVSTDPGNHGREPFRPSAGTSCRLLGLKLVACIPDICCDDRSYMQGCVQLLLEFFGTGSRDQSALPCIKRHFGTAVQLMRHAKPLWEPKTYRGATNKRRFYEEITMPKNLVGILWFETSLAVPLTATGEGGDWRVAVCTCEARISVMQHRQRSCCCAPMCRVTDSKFRCSRSS